MKRHIQKIRTIKIIKAVILIAVMTWVLFGIYCRMAGPLDITWK